MQRNGFFATRLTLFPRFHFIIGELEIPGRKRKDLEIERERDRRESSFTRLFFITKFSVSFISPAYGIRSP